MNFTRISFITIFFVITAYFGMSWVVADQSLMAKPHALTTTPTEFGISFESVTFHPLTEPDVTLRGWWMPRDNSKATVIWVHGLDSARDGRMEFLANLYSEGYSILTFDLRGHGESDKVPIGGGAYEHRDVQGAINLAKVKAPGNSILMIGISFGAALVILTGDDDTSVRGIVADSSFASIPELIKEEVSARTPLPEWGAALLKPGVIFAAKWFKNADVAKVSPEMEVGKIPFPIALIHCKASHRIPFSHAQRILKQAPKGSSTLFIDDCDHAQGYEEDKITYVEFVLDYLDNQLSQR